MSQTEILPQIYSSGIFKLKGKLVNYLSESIWYTCIAIRKIEEIETLGINCFEEYYKPIGLNELEYQSDANFNACIITLKSSNGELKHFPSTYLRAFPNGSGVLYSVMGIAIELGALPLDYDLGPFTEDLKTYIHNTIGINPRTRLLTLSNTEIITMATHERIKKARENAIQSTDNLKHVNKQLSDENQLLKKKIKELEKYIIDHDQAIKDTPLTLRSNGFVI